MSATIPMFVVVGNVNQGKSSIVAALAEDDTVPIASHPGTTTRTGEYTFAIEGQPVFQLVDTPGFQDARRTLAWLQDRAPSPAGRRDAVAAFVREHEGAERFHDEVELLRPILEGAGVLYVVDASARFQPSNEAEMEILRWTGQSAMALLNRTRERDWSDEWRPILEQFFNIVREFDAHHAGFDDRLRLLRGFREVREDWRAQLDRAIGALEQDWDSRVRRAAVLIADLMADALGHVERRPLGEDDPEAPVRAELEQAYRDKQRKLEQDARDAVERVFRHRRLDCVQPELSVAATDLFSDTSWRLFGLSRMQLAKYGAGWGAALGAAIDLMVGGLSFFAGAGIGASVGALTGWFGGREVARVWGSQSKLAKVLFPGDTGRFLYMGPVTSPRYAWILFDRALVHYAAIKRRSHARQDDLELEGIAKDEDPGIVHTLPSELRDRVDRSLRDLLKEILGGRISIATREGFRQTVELVLADV